MKVLMLNGSPNENGCTYTALREVEKTLHKHGIETEIVYLGNRPIHGCMACRRCADLNYCIINDEVQMLQSRLDEFDAIVLGSPVYYAAPAGRFIAFLDRLFFGSGYGKGGKLNGKLGAAVVSCRRGGASAAFDQLNKYFAISNMPIVPSQYWNQVHGNSPEEVLKDEEGLQTMRALGENMAWLLKCIKLGKDNNVPLPEYEDRIRTNFIR